MLKDNLPQTIFLNEYKPSAFLIERTELWVELYEEHTEVRAQINLVRNPEEKAPKDKDLSLNAEAMKVLAISLDGKSLKEDKHYSHEDTTTYL